MKYCLMGSENNIPKTIYIIVVLNLGELSLVKDFDLNYYTVNFCCVADLIYFYFELLCIDIAAKTIVTGAEPGVSKISY
jgi:hypothetical protein